tara:strand:- start:2672 stop:4213 length:1542 start_codon:yes stop_codon:yes gene_type:complete
MDIKKNKIISYLCELSTGKLLFILFTLFFLFSFFVTIPSYTHYFDEGWTASISNELAQGKLLYKDISAPYGPAVFYLYSAIISFLGKEFFLFRIVGCMIIMLQAFFTTKIVNLYTSEKKLILFSALISLISLGTYQGCRITASTIAGLTTLMIIFYHLKFLSKNDNKYLILMGALFVLQLLTKHNVFALDVAANGIFMLFHSFTVYKKTGVFNWSYFLIPTIAFIGFLTPYIIYVFPYIKILLNDTILTISEYKASDITIPFPSPLSFLKMDFLDIRSSLFLYSIFPLFIASALILFDQMKNKKLFQTGILLILLSTFFHYVEVYPLSDYSHYVRATVLYPSSIAILLYLTNLNRSTTILFSIILVILLHLYPSLTNVYSSLKYRIFEPDSELPYHLNIKKIINEDVMIEVLHVVKNFNEDQLLIIGHANIYYYLSDKKTNSRFNIITHSYLNEEDEKQVIKEIELNRIKYIMEPPSVRKLKELEQLSILNTYISENFHIFKEIGGYNFWVRN